MACFTVPRHLAQSVCDNRGMSNLRIGALAALLALGAVSFGQTAPPTADAVMKEAQALAAKEKKAVWVIFHASW
jgi:hypothetical protein